MSVPQKTPKGKDTLSEKNKAGSLFWLPPKYTATG
jgi:hypothetical protein